MIRTTERLGQLRLTPTEAAKLIVWFELSRLAEDLHMRDWPQEAQWLLDPDALTEGERDRVEDAIRKQLQRVEKLLGHPQETIVWQR